MQIVPRESTAEEVSFEWSHHRISFTDSKVRTILNVSVTDSGSERVKLTENLSFEPQYQQAYSSHCSPNITYGTKWKKLLIEEMIAEGRRGLLTCTRVVHDHLKKFI